MKPSNSPDQSRQTDLEAELTRAVGIVQTEGYRMFITPAETNQHEIRTAIAQNLGADRDTVIRKFSFPASEADQTEGDISVRVFPTKYPSVFLGEYTRQNGQTIWALRPKHCVEEED